MEPQSTALTTWLRSPLRLPNIAQALEIDLGGNRSISDNLECRHPSGAVSHPMHKLNSIKSALIGLLAVVGGAMAIANPSQPQYEEYAIAQLTAYLKDNVCTQAPKDFGDVLPSYCTSLVDVGRPQLQKMIAENTDQLNFIFFSIYRTELSIGPFLPGYQFETLAVFDKFYTYQAQKQ